MRASGRGECALKLGEEPVSGPPGIGEKGYLTCAETSFVNSNMLTCFLPPKTALRAGSALIIVLFLGS